MNILLFFAMKEESRKTIEHFNFQQQITKDSALPFQLYNKHINGNNIFLCNAGIDPRFKVNAVGTIPAALTTYEISKKFEIDLVINPGTAGGFKSQGGEIGDIYLPSKVIFHHREIPMGDYEQYGIGSYDVYDSKKLEDKLDFKTGVFSTSDSLIFHNHEKEIFKKNNVVVKEMEAAAIAYVCEQVRIPYLGVKSITDIVDGDRVTSEEFLENLETASINLQEFLILLLDHI
jgi:5'-methylthioadenosine nucleosidase